MVFLGVVLQVLELHLVLFWQVYLLVVYKYVRKTLIFVLYFFSDQGVCFASWYSFSFVGHFSLFSLYFKFSILIYVEFVSENVYLSFLSFSQAP